MNYEQQKLPSSLDELNKYPIKDLVKYYLYIVKKYKKNK